MGKKKNPQSQIIFTENGQIIELIQSTSFWTRCKRFLNIYFGPQYPQKQTDSTDKIQISVAKDQAFLEKRRVFETAGIVGGLSLTGSGGYVVGLIVFGIALTLPVYIFFIGALLLTALVIGAVILGNKIARANTAKQIAAKTTSVQETHSLENAPTQEIKISPAQTLQNQSSTAIAIRNFSSTESKELYVLLFPGIGVPAKNEVMNTAMKEMLNELGDKAALVTFLKITPHTSSEHKTLLERKVELIIKFIANNQLSNLEGFEEGLRNELDFTPRKSISDPAEKAPTVTNNDDNKLTNFEQHAPKDYFQRETFAP